MTETVFIAAAGIVSPLGNGLDATATALQENRTAIAPLTLFPLLQGTPLPVGQVPDLEDGPLPRTHRLARQAARMVMAEAGTPPPEMVLLGSTTGGILTTEDLLRAKSCDQAAYRYHGLASVAEDIADLCDCRGPACTVSTACSSGAVAIALALNLLRSGQATRILAGGVDALSRLTYFGFHSLQLVDRNGCRPLDVDRQGLAVGEGAALLLLTTTRPDNPLGVLLGAGLSCDAHHPTAPHPEGRGAHQAMQSALRDAGLEPAAIDYINLHGTGTRDNDLAEARAICKLFPNPPPLSSIKGATGHSLAAAGAIEAVVAALAVSRHLVPANTGGRQPDPDLGLLPERTPGHRPVATVLSNSFGFGGNNGCLVVGQADTPAVATRKKLDDVLAIHGSACLTGAGLQEATLTALQAGTVVAGMLPARQLEEALPARRIRRIKRLARLALLLAQEADQATGNGVSPSAVFMGTGWGALSETYDFLTRLTESNEQFPSPTDFVGSVHNSPAGQVALHSRATGANVTTSGGDHSFEQALLAALALLGEDETALLLGADEGHAPLSCLLDPSISDGQPLADGGGALQVSRNRHQARCLVRLPFYGRGNDKDLPERLIDALGGVTFVTTKYAAVLAGIPAGSYQQGMAQLENFFHRIGQRLPLWPYRACIGEFASASAVAAAMAATFVEAGTVPGALLGGADLHLDREAKLLVLGTGKALTAMEFFRP